MVFVKTSDVVDVPDTWLRYSDFVEDDIPIAECERTNPNDPVLVICTSGTTGKPKYLVRSHINAIAPARSLRYNYNLKNGDIIAGLTTFGFSLYYQF